MVKKNKLKTPDWILKGYGSEAEYNKVKGIDKKKKSGETFKVRKCPECSSDNVGVVLSGSDTEEGGGKEWECHKCGWNGTEINEEELSEDEFMEYLDKKGEEVA